MSRFMMRKKKMLITLLISTFFVFQLTACGESDSGSTSEQVQTESASKKIVPHEATQEQADMILAERQQAVEGKVLSSKVDQKFVNKDFMVTGLVNTDCSMAVDENGLSISVPSGNAAIFVSVTPGIQNATRAASSLQDYVTANYSQEGTGGTYTGTVFGYNATVIPFTTNLDNQIVNGFASVFIANQSLYRVSFLYYSTASQNELDLMSKVFPSIQIIKPVKVDNSSKKAVYTDPYAGYKVYDPYLYYYISGAMAYEDYLAAFEDYYSYFDLAMWDAMPYDFYSWYDGTYDGYTEEDFIADYNYYDDEDYWNWGWDDDTDWTFYDAYQDYYDAAYYSELEDYYATYGDDIADYSIGEEADFSDEYGDTWQDIDLSGYEESDYEYADYYDDYYSSDDSSYDDSGDDGGYDDSYDDSYDDGGGYDDSYDDGGGYDDSYE